jgi:4-hydroxy-tetrahydrodipicolinate synthase
MESGIEGFMTGFAFPEALKAMVNADKAGRPDEVRRIYQHWLPLMVFEQQPGVGVRKEIYRLRGIIADGHVRHPAPSIAPSAAKMLAAAIEATLPGVDVTKPLDIDSL